MLTLINTNRMTPPVGPIGLDYIAAAAEKAGISVEILDLCFTEKPDKSVREYFSGREPDLVGLTFRNTDDSFWPSADWFVPSLKETIQTLHSLTRAPIVVGGVGFSIFAESIFEHVECDFGVRGDGENAIVALIRQLREEQNFVDVPGLLWREKGKIRSNPISAMDPISLGTERSFVDNLSYFKHGGQCGLETKRGCNRNCIYCADPIAKGNKLRLRDPCEVADEVQSLLKQGIDVFHICDSEFNVSRNHAYAVCEEFIRRSLGERLRWYTYMLPSPFDAALAQTMAQAGCAGIDFTGDSACNSMLQTYRQQHNRDDIAKAVELCRLNNITVMVDLLLGGPGETPETISETINFMKKINPDCVGATLGVRIYPGTYMGSLVAEQFSRGNLANIRRKYHGRLDLLRPTFYISAKLGQNPTQLVKDIIDKDKRFFEPADEIELKTTQNRDLGDYNYNENIQLTKKIEDGARGAYWDILRKIRNI